MSSQLKTFYYAVIATCVRIDETLGTLPIGTLQREEGSYKKDFERFREFCGFRHCIFSIKIDDFYLISSLTLWSVIKSAVHDGDNGGRSEIGEGFEVNNVECRSVVCCLKIKIKIAIQAPNFDNSLITKRPESRSTENDRQKALATYPLWFIFV